MTAVGPLPTPHGDLSTALAQQIADTAVAVWQAAKSTADTRHLAIRSFLHHLATFPGATWQQRWEASGFDDCSRMVHHVDLGPSATATAAVRMLASLRVICPSLLALRRNTFTDYAASFFQAQRDPLLNEYVSRIRAASVSLDHQRRALNDIAYALTTQRVALAHLGPAALMQYVMDWRATAPNTDSKMLYTGQLVWQTLHAMGHFPPQTPPTLRLAMVGTQVDIATLVDQQKVRHPAVRQLLIDYVEHRRAEGMDYSSLRGLVRKLAGNFWALVEQINPGQADLRLDSKTYGEWRQRIGVLPNGEPRQSLHDILFAVRALYLDLQSWAVDEPERWAQWVAPCPVETSHRLGHAKGRRRQIERMNDRTRRLQPLLPLLHDYVTERLAWHRDLLDRAASTAPFEVFTFRGETFQRAWTAEDSRTVTATGTMPLRVRRLPDGGRAFSVEAAYEDAFFQWAAVEVLRLTGVRIEELLELTHLSVRQYQRPNGEVVALLVIAPSKTDRERVIPMSAELFHVIASLVRHHSKPGQPIPLACRWDGYEKQLSAPMPFLFARQIGPTRQVISNTWVLKVLRRCCQALADRHPQLVGIHFTPHDFRRIFATDLVNNGVPIHIGAALLGHLSVQTTRGYVTVFNDTVISHYQQFLQRRRNLRPAEEYRPVTDSEWVEFEDHFDRRKVELGTCARPYGTPCQHEHACIRCPMLNINPDMLPRLDELEADLLDRRARAEREQWLGETEGIDLTLQFLRQKRADAARIVRRTPIHLGLPQSP